MQEQIEAWQAENRNISLEEMARFLDCDEDALANVCACPQSELPQLAKAHAGTLIGAIAACRIEPNSRSWLKT